MLRIINASASLPLFMVKPDELEVTDVTRKRVRWALRILTLALAVLGAFIGWRWGSGNYGSVVPARVFRSAQPSSMSLAKVVKRDGIKTVLNLRGSNPDEEWYRAEKDATLSAGATQIDFPMSSDQWLSHEQVRALLEILDTSEYPILIHCEWGAERTGLVSAIVALLKDGSTLADGRREFSAYYLFLPMKDGLVMRGHLDLYERWLADRGKTHSPATLRHWLMTAYQPGSPSREHWPCNPYPLKVVSRAGADGVMSWGSVRCK